MFQSKVLGSRGFPTFMKAGSDVIMQKSACDVKSTKYECGRNSNDSVLTKRFVVKITVERCDKIKVAVSQIFDRVKSVALWSTNIRKLAKNHKGYGSAAS